MMFSTPYLSSTHPMYTHLSSHLFMMIYKSIYESDPLYFQGGEVYCLAVLKQVNADFNIIGR